jgi:hypothetical protein
MATKRYIQLSVVIGLIALIVPLTQGWAAEHPQKAAKAATMTLEQLHAKQIPLALKSLETLKKAIEAGHKEHALMELKKAQGLLAIVQQTLGQHVKPEFANTVCPIMGSKFDPSKLPASLIRKFNGQKVGFCCAGCPAQWDKLSNAQKQSKLTKAKPSKAMQHMH